MIELKRFTEAEIFDLFHKDLGDGAWQVVRCKIYTKADAVKRIHTLMAKASRFNANLDGLQAVKAIGKKPIEEELSILTGYLMDNKTRLAVGVYDCIRECILIACLFGLVDSEKVEGSLLLK